MMDVADTGLTRSIHSAHIARSSRTVPRVDGEFFYECFSLNFPDLLITKTIKNVAAETGNYMYVDDNLCSPSKHGREQ